MLQGLIRYYDSKGISPNRTIPRTFFIRSQEDGDFCRFEEELRREKEAGLRSIWIVKPGENSNRGRGIFIIQELKELRNQLPRWEKAGSKSFVVQRYIERPMLYQKRKFDLRHFVLLAQLHGVLRGYWYE
jgi:tubulin--tyrosine ligase